MEIPAVILVGGLGTRLRSVIGEYPKPMVDIDGKPFLEYLIGYLKGKGITDVILCVGYKAEIAKDHFGNGNEFGVNVKYAIEDELLGTAGAAKNAEPLLEDCEDFLLLNGDSFLDFNLDEFVNFHKSKDADFSFIVTHSKEKGRFGNVILDENQNLVEFAEKSETSQAPADAYINAGVYLLKKEVLKMIPDGEKFSLEYDLVPSLMSAGKKVCGFPVDSELIDIGTPESLEYFRSNLSKFF